MFTFYSVLRFFNQSGIPLWLRWWRVCLQWGRPGFDPWVGKIPWRRERLPTPAIWSGKFHGLYNHGVAKNWLLLNDFNQSIKIFQVFELYTYEKRYCCAFKREVERCSGWPSDLAMGLLLGNSRGESDPAVWCLVHWFPFISPWQTSLDSCFQAGYSSWIRECFIYNSLYTKGRKDVFCFFL